MSADQHTPHAFARPLDLVHGRVDMTHGGGGRATIQLVAEVFAPAFSNPFLDRNDDMAMMPRPRAAL